MFVVFNMIHYLTKSMRTPARRTSHSKITGINMELLPPLLRLCLARSLHSNSSQRCLMGLRSGLCAGQSSYSTPISTNNFCMDLAL